MKLEGFINLHIFPSLFSGSVWMPHPLSTFGISQEILFFYLAFLKISPCISSISSSKLRQALKKQKGKKKEEKELASISLNLQIMVRVKMVRCSLL